MIRIARMKTTIVIFVQKACAPTLRKLEATMLLSLTIHLLMKMIGTMIADIPTDANSHKRCPKPRKCSARVKVRKAMIRTMTKRCSLSGAVKSYSHLSRKKNKPKNR